MRTRLLLTMFFVLITVGALAGTRTKEEMKEAAMRVLVKNSAARGMAHSSPSSNLKEYLTKEKLSVIGSEDLGFAVVTNDDRFDEVIGYSESPFLDAMPCGFKWWLDAANETMEKSNGEVPAKARVMNTTNRGTVGPLITTKWGQSKPYNDKCKITVNGEEYSLLTGCAATAMAQIMNYYKYPTKGKGENSYTINYTDCGVIFAPYSIS